MKDNKKFFEDDVIQEKVKKKVETKSNISKRVKTSQSVKECEVLVYDQKNNSIIISFDGFGFELKNINKNPGETVSIKYSGDINSPDFKLEVC